MPDELSEGCLYPATFPYNGIFPVVFRGKDPQRRPPVPPDPVDGGLLTGVDSWLVLPPFNGVGGGTGVCAWLEPEYFKLIH